MAEKTKNAHYFTCGQCAKTWRKSGTTHCWSNDSKAALPQPGNCPSKDHMEVIQESFDLYKGDGEEAKIAQVAARVEGLCYLSPCREARR